MHKVGVIIYSEVKERLKRKGFWIATLVLPLVILAPFLVTSLFAPNSSKEQKLLVVQDKTGHLLSSVGAQLSKDGEIKPVTFKQYDFSTLEKIRQEIEDGVFWGLLVLDKTPEKEFQADLYTASQLSVVSKKTLDLTIQLAVKQALLEEFVANKEEKIRAANTPIQITNQPINPEGFQRGGMAKYVVSYFSGLLMYITMLIYGIQVMNAVIMEKSSRIMEVLISSVSPLMLMVGKICGVGLVALIQYAIWGTSFVLIGLSGSWLDASQSGDLLSLLTPELILSIFGFFILGYLMYASMYAAVGALVEQHQDAQALHMPVTFLVILPVLILPQVIIDPMQGWVRILAQVPFFSPTLMVTRIATGSVMLWEIGSSILFLILGFWAVSALAGKLYQVGVLSYGQKPTLQTIWGYLRS